MTGTRYPEIEVQVARDHRPLLIAATRQALRRARVEQNEIHRFSAQAFASDDAATVCREWVRLVIRPASGG
jgi:hypothetical protein